MKKITKEDLQRVIDKVDGIENHTFMDNWDLNIRRNKRNTKLCIVALLTILVCVINKDANAQSGDSTSLNINGYRAQMQQRPSSGTNGVYHAVSVPYQTQTIYITQPTQTTYVTQNGTVQCNSYTTVMSGYRYASSQESMHWGGCSAMPPIPTMPNGTIVNNSSTAPTSSNAQCLPQYYLVPVYTNVCNG